MDKHNMVFRNYNMAHMGQSSIYQSKQDYQTNLGNEGAHQLASYPKITRHTLHNMYITHKTCLA